MPFANVQTPGKGFALDIPLWLRFGLWLGARKNLGLWVPVASSWATSQALLLFNVAEAFTAICSWYLTTQEQTHEHLLRTS